MPTPDFSRFGTLADAAPDFSKFGTPVDEPGKSVQPGKRSLGNARPWSEVASSPAFNALSPSEREAARGQYFDQVVAPKVAEDERTEAREQFDKATRKTFVFTSPEGKSYDVEGPEGATKEQAYEVLRQKLANRNAAIPTKKRPLEEAGSFKLDEHADTSPVDDALDFSKRVVDTAWDFAKDTVLTTFGLEHPKSASTGGDFGRALGKGLTVDVAETIQGVNEMAKQAPLGMLVDAVTPTFLKQVRDSANDAVMAAVQRRGKTISAGMTDESKASNEKTFFTKEASWANLSKDGIAKVPERIAELVSNSKFFGEGWSDARKIGLSATESAPVSVLSMLPVIRASRTAHELALARALAAGASESEAKAIALSAAKNTASKAGALSEGGIGAGQQWTQTYHQVLDLPQEKLDQSPEYQDALDAMPRDWTPARRAIEARKAVAKASANTAAVVAGVADALFAGMGDRYIGGAVAGRGGRTRSAATGVAQETPTETLQSGAEQFGSNLGIKTYADPSQPLMADVGEQAVAGGLSGGLMGGVFGGAAHTRAQRPTDTGGGEPVPATGVLGMEESAPSPSEPAAPARTPETGGIESMLADPQALFEAVTARPAIFATIEDALQAMPEVQDAPPEQVQSLADALKEMEGNPQAIFAIATSKPALYQTIARAAAQTEKLGRGVPAAQPAASVAEVAAPSAEPAPTDEGQAAAEPTPAHAPAPAPAPASQPDPVAAQMEAAWGKREAAAAKQRGAEESAARDQKMREDYQQELARAEASNSGLRPEVPKTALQLELERMGLTPDKFRRADPEQGQPLLRRGQETDAGLVARLSARNGRDMRLATVTETPRSLEASAAVKVASSFGKRVVFIHTPQRVAGLVLPEDPNTIFVNVKSSHPVLPIVGHELLHTLRRTNQAIYKELHGRLVPLMKDVPEFRAWLSEALTEEGDPMTGAELDDLTHEELIADFLGDHMTKRDFWAEVFRGQDRNWVQKIRDSVMIALDALRIRLSLGGKRGFGSEHYIKDVDGVRRALAEAFNAWSREAQQKPEARRSPRVAESQVRSPSGQREAGVTPGRGAALPGELAMASREAESKPAELATLARTKKEPSAGLKALQTRLSKESRGVKIETAQPAGKASDIRNQSLIDWEKKHGPYPQGRAKRIGENGSPWVAADANGVPIKTSPQFDDMGAAARWSQYIQIAERLTQHSKTKGAKVVLELADAFAKKIIANGQASVVAAVPDQLAHEAATSPKNTLPEPTPAQVEIGNYRKGHMRIGGLDISIENPEGSKRRPEWPTLRAHYGYIKGTVGRDKDHVDVFVKPGTPQDYVGPVFVIDQKKASGRFDETKVMLGWPDMPAAKAGYEENYTKGWDGLKDITLFRTMDEFRAWLEHGDTKQPAAPQILYARERSKPTTRKQSSKLDQINAILAVAKKVKAPREQKRALLGGIRRLLTLAPWLQDAVLSVSSWVTLSDPTAYGTFDSKTRQIQISEDLLNPASLRLLELLTQRPQELMEKAKAVVEQAHTDTLVETIAHELGHAHDYRGSVDVTMLRDDFRVAGPSLKLRAVGQVIAEAVELWGNRRNLIDAELRDYLEYPFKYWPGDGKDRGFFRREWFAQLVAMHTTHRELLKENLPHGYALIESLANGERWNAFGHGQNIQEEDYADAGTGGRERIGDQRVSEEVRGDTDLGSMAAGKDHRGEDRAAPSSPGHEHASEAGSTGIRERGRASVLEPLFSRERDQTQTPEFKRFIVGSRATKTGEPWEKPGDELVVYHGTNRSFDAFDPNAEPLNYESDRGKQFFLDSREGASNYAQGTNDGEPNVMPVYLSIKNPRIVETDLNPSDWWDRQPNYAWDMDVAGLGHDGLIVRGEGETMYVTTHPTQIKSAIGNSGAFDPNNPSILYARERTSPGHQFEPRLELEKQSTGDWMSPDGRFEVLREADGFWAKVDGSEIGWGRTYAQARAWLLRQFQSDLTAGRIQNPSEARAVLNRYTPEQRSGVIDVWAKIASLPGAFRLAHTTATDPKTIAHDLGVNRTLMLLEDNDMGFGEGYLDMRFVDGSFAQVRYITSAKEAYVDASNMEQGGLGAQVYQLAFTWAANNKYTLVPDPNGLSLINTYRRTEQMLSGALRLGTTRYMRPHPDQGLFGWVNDVKTEADEDTNLALLLITSYENVFKADPDVRGKLIEKVSRLVYNFTSQKFEDRRGESVKGQQWKELAEAEASRAVGSGITTLQRAVLTKSILAESDKRGGKGLATLVQDVPARGILDDEHPLRAILYARQRDPGSGQVAGVGVPGKSGALRAAALGTARAAVSAGRVVAAPLDLANRGIEAAVRLPAKLLVAPVTSRLYDRVVGIGRALAQKNPLAQEIAHGLVADYGLPEPYLDARQERDSRIQAVLRRSKALIDQIASLTRSEARVAYLWMQESPSSAIEAQLLAQLPESSKQTLAAMKQQIDAFGQEAVRLGLLSQESYDRNHQAYLHRTYKKHELENPQVASAGQKAKSIRADAYRGRGLKDDVAASRLPGVQKGDKYNRLELRDPGSAGQLGKLKRVVYLKAGLPVPQTYAGWRNDGVWEARWMPAKAGDSVGMWRDMSAEERERLGEIDEVRYAFARTMLATTRDIETARFLDWVRRTYAKETEEAVVAAGQRVSAAVDAAMTVKTYANDEWVQVPQTLAQGMRVKRYGALAGQYVPGHIWNDIRSTMNFRSESAAWRLYDELLRAWKISKTGLSLVVHTNNVMSNFVLADMADVRLEHIRQSLRTIIDAQRGDEAARAVMERFYASGAESGSQSLIELRTEVIEPMLAELAREEDETLATLSLMQAVSLAIHGSLRQALAVFSAKKLGRWGAKPFKTMIDLYRSEDSVFRLAKFLKETAAGKTDREAGKEARVVFLDYNINAPWIQALRRGPLPFISFSYRAIPLLIQAAAKRPEKMMKYFAVGYAMNALTYAFLGAAGDEDRERRLMPDEKSGWALGIFYRMLRMPWNDEHGSPVFLDVRRWIPGGDIMDLTGSKSALPLPQWLSVGGPLSLFIELAANKSLFTGKAITKESDTAGEQIVKLTDHLFKFIVPNLPIPNPGGPIVDAAMQEHGLYQTYSWKSIQAAITGETDAAGRPRDLGRAVLSSVGVKLMSHPEDLAKKNIRLRRDFLLREIGETMSGYRRQAEKGGLTTEELRQRIERQNQKKRDITQRYNERAGLRRIE